MTADKKTRSARTRPPPYGATPPFVFSLFHDIGKCKNFTVTSADGAIWEPFSESLEEFAGLPARGIVRFTFVPARGLDNHEAFATFMMARILPAASVRFLQKYEVLEHILLFVASKSLPGVTRANVEPFFERVKAWDQASVASDRGTPEQTPPPSEGKKSPATMEAQPEQPKETKSPEKVGPPLGEYALSEFAELLRSRKLRANTPSADVLVGRKFVCLTHPGAFDLLAEAVRKKYPSDIRARRLREGKEHLEGQIAKVKSQICNLLSVLRDSGAAGFKSVQSELKRLEGEQGTVERTLEETRGVYGNLKQRVLNQDVMVCTLGRLAEILDHASPSELKLTLSLFVERVVFYPPDQSGEGKMTLAFFEKAAEQAVLGAVVTPLGEFRGSVAGGSPRVPVLEPARRGGPPEPEVYFRIVHMALDAADGTPAYREQTVEIALGPKGAFENGNIGSITRQVPSEQVVNALAPRARNRKPPKEPKTPQVVVLLRKAIAWRALLDSGEASSQADIARQEGVTRARVTQVLGMLRLAPEIQERILAMPEVMGRAPVTERDLRRASRMAHAAQQRLFESHIA